MIGGIQAVRRMALGCLAGSAAWLCAIALRADEGPTAPPAPIPPPTVFETQAAARVPLASEICQWRVTPPAAANADLPIGNDAAPAGCGPTFSGWNDCWGWPSWANVPPLEPTPRPGLFLVPPTGAGYYTLRDWFSGACNPKPPAYPYRLMNYENDFRYLDTQTDAEIGLCDSLKRIHFGDDWLLSIGGDERARYMDEHNGYLKVTGQDNDYALFRSRVYADLWYQDRFRFFAQFYDGEVTGEDLPPNKTDVNKSDFLDLFADVALLDVDSTPVYLRVGRQEMLYGSQRLTSNLDWANTERTFQGVKAFWHSKNWDLDAFWTQPVLVDPTHFDAPDDKANFAGVWSTYKPRKGVTWDTYYLYLDNARSIATGVGGTVGGNVVQTIGSRYAGDCSNCLWDFEGMYQFGDNANQNISAGAFTAGVGYRFADWCADPQVWMYYDFASGNQHPGSGDYGTFNQLFPFGHYYLGYLDLVGRQNIGDLNWQFVCFPTPWLTAGIQYHMFDLVSSRDALYNAAGTPIAVDPTGQSGHDVGNEVDLFEKFQIDVHQDVLIGYSQLTCGGFLKATKHLDEIDFGYAQYCFRW